MEPKEMTPRMKRLAEREEHLETLEKSLTALSEQRQIAIDVLRALTERDTQGNFKVTYTFTKFLQAIVVLDTLQLAIRYSERMQKPNGVSLSPAHYFGTGDIARIHRYLNRKDFEEACSEGNDIVIRLLAPPDGLPAQLTREQLLSGAVKLIPSPGTNDLAFSRPTCIPDVDIIHTLNKEQITTSLRVLPV